MITPLQFWYDDECRSRTKTRPSKNLEISFRQRNASFTNIIWNKRKINDDKSIRLDFRTARVSKLRELVEIASNQGCTIAKILLCKWHYITYTSLLCIARWFTNTEIYESDGGFRRPSNHALFLHLLAELILIAANADGPLFCLNEVEI